MSQSGRKMPNLVAENRYAARKPAAKPAAPKSRAKRKPAPRKPRGPLGWIGRGLRWALRILFRLFWSIGIVACLIVGGAVVYTATTLPPVDDLIDGRARGSVTLLDDNGAPFAWRGDQFGGMITAGTVSDHLRNAVVATEDKRFYWHIGVSPRGVASAVRINLQAGRGALSGNGGSTITQQTAKLLCQGQPYDAAIWPTEAAYEEDCRRTTIWRKATEAVYAMAMELRYTKDEILTLYLNRAYLGAGTRGFEAASQRYFGISAAEVNPSQAAILAGLLKAPSTYAPTTNLERSWERANVVLQLMEDQGYLTTAQANEARTNPAPLSQAAEARAGGYFADWVMDTGPSYFTETTTEDVIIRTTLDQDIQSAAEEALAWVFENKVREGSEAQAAIVVMSADGAVRAMVGGRETKVAGVFNRATQALRQTGSLFKPFIYATALELGREPYDIVIDEPLCMNIPGSGEWCPQNYDREFKGPITLTDALANSRNVPAVIVSEEAGREAVQTIARGFGMTGELADGPALALGVTESTLVEMAGAYAGILNGGSSVQPYGLVDLRLLGDDTSLMGSGGGIGERIIREESAQKLTWMMYQVVEVGSGVRAGIDGWEIAGKSGTTQGARDAWFIGFTADYVTAVWMGYDNNTPLTGVTGGGLPATIWHETMIRVLEDKEPKPLPMIVPTPPAPQAVPDTTGSGSGFIDSLLQDLLGGGGN